jgi:hypothetical protein
MTGYLMSDILFSNVLAHAFIKMMKCMRYIGAPTDKLVGI